MNKTEETTTKFKRQQPNTLFKDWVNPGSKKPAQRDILGIAGEMWVRSRY